LNPTDAKELGADLIIDVYFISPDCLLEFEDFADKCSVELADKLGIQVIIISHSEDATKKYYKKVL
jgi:hypothetical protein